mmetsp:Transcript_3986/g.25106  ORF Transcript_3986/g.25106 Transcript_3986/m.25106 type:complete len:81 (+) Transcript_3986:759-1001(+)
MEENPFNAFIEPSSGKTTLYWEGINEEPVFCPYWDGLIMAKHPRRSDPASLLETDERFGDKWRTEDYDLFSPLPVHSSAH